MSTPEVDSNAVKPKGSKWIWWVLGLVMLVAIGYGGYWIGKLQNPNVKLQTNNKTQNPNIQTPTPTTPAPTTPVKDTADLPAKDSSTEGWKTYENKDYGFSFKYPNMYYILDKVFEEGQTFKSTAIDNVESDGTLFPEGCSGLYTMSANKVKDIPGGSFIKLGEKQSYDYLDNPDITPIKINSNQGYRITGVYNKDVIYEKVGEQANIAVILDGNDYITFHECKSVRYKTFKGTKKEFDQILSTFKFIK